MSKLTNILSFSLTIYTLSKISSTERIISLRLLGNDRCDLLPYPKSQVQENSVPLLKRQPAKAGHSIVPNQGGWEGPNPDESIAIHVHLPLPIISTKPPWPLYPLAPLPQLYRLTVSRTKPPSQRLFTLKTRPQPFT